MCDAKMNVDRNIVKYKFGHFITLALTKRQRIICPIFHVIAAGLGWQPMPPELLHNSSK
jgi:hypothetical protein